MGQAKPPHLAPMHQNGSKFIPLLPRCARCRTRPLKRGNLRSAPATMRLARYNSARSGALRPPLGGRCTGQFGRKVGAKCALVVPTRTIIRHELNTKRGRLISPAQGRSTVACAPYHLTSSPLALCAPPALRTERVAIPAAGQAVARVAIPAFVQAATRAALSAAGKRRRFRLRASGGAGS